jgi:peptide-methionine (R)-S-oxide reductase
MNRREVLGMASVGVVVAGLVGYRVIARGDPNAPDPTLRVSLTDAQWKGRLSPASYAVLRKGDTEYRFSSALLKEHRKGTFTCAGCDQPLFSSATKYDSHTGWPSFWESLPGAVTRHLDFSSAQPRTEIRCSSCGGHLGHVFSDGPQPTRLRYCMNGIALAFHPNLA